VTYVLNFGTPSIFREKLEFETLNLAYGLTTRGINERSTKLSLYVIYCRLRCT